MYEKWKSGWSRCVVSLVGGLLCFPTVLLAKDDLALFTFQAQIRGGEARAICLKADAEDLKAFCYYYSAIPGTELLQRSDDSNFSAELRAIQGDQDDALGRWLKTIDASYGIDQNTVKSFLGRLRSDQATGSDLQSLLSQSTWATSLNPIDKDLGSLSDMVAVRGQITAFLSATRTDHSGGPPPVQGETGVDPNKEEVRLKAINEATKKALEEHTEAEVKKLDPRFARIRGLLYLLLAVAGLLAATTLWFVVATPPARPDPHPRESIYKEIYSSLRQSAAGASNAEAALDRILQEHNPDDWGQKKPAPPSPPSPYQSAATTEGGFRNWFRKKSKPEGSGTAAVESMEALRSFHQAVVAFRVEWLLTQNAASQESEAAQAILAEVLGIEGRSGEGLLGKARAAATLLHELRARVAKISPPPAATSLSSGIETLIRDLEGSSSSFSEFVKKVILVAEPLGEHKISLRDVSPGAGEQALEIIKLHLSDYDDALRVINDLGYSRAELPSAVKDYGQLLGDLGERFHVRPSKEARETLADFWRRLRESVNDLPGGLLENSSPGTLLGKLVSALRDCRSEKERLLEGLQRQERGLEELARVETGLSTVREPNESAAACVQRILDENRAASSAMEEIGTPGQGLLSKAQGASQLLRAVGQKIRKALPDSNGDLDVAVSQLAEEVLDLRDSQRPQVELIAEFCRSVRFNVEDVGDPVCLKGLLGAVQLEATGPQRQLRLGLCAALAMWDTAVLQLREGGRQDVVNALQLKAIRDALPTILGLMQNRQTEELLDRCLAEGFAKNGFHHLFRAETLLNTYFNGLPLFDGIREWAALTGAAVRAALRRLDCEVQMIPLLQPIPRLPEDRLEVRPEASPELRKVKEVWERVNSLLVRREHADAVVDVQLFLRSEQGQLKGTCRVITLNPAEWRTFEGAVS